MLSKFLFFFFLNHFLFCANSSNTNVKALWVVRDYLTQKHLIDEVLYFANKNDFNHIFVQVRGRGDAYYNSEIVPKSHLVETDFDPLDYLINSNFHIIADYQVDKIQKYFTISPPKVNYKIHKTKHKGTCAGIKDALKNIDENKKILIIWSDLIIDKLPFPNPADPIYEAEARRLSTEGGNSFVELALPRMIFSLRQGVITKN